MNDYEQIVRQAAKSLGLLDDREELIPLDSMMTIDLVMELERAASLSIPGDVLGSDAFASVESTATMLRDVTTQART